MGWAAHSDHGTSSRERRSLLAALAALLLAMASFSAAGQEAGPVTDPETGVTAWHELDRVPARHVEGEVLYAQVPPAGGPHNAVWQNCGFYSQPIYNWHGVHSLEHGAIWITYDPDLPQDDIDELESLVRMGHVLITPYPGLTDPVVASAWGRQVRLGGSSDPRLMEFIVAYRMSPETAPEPGAICSLGTDATLAPGDTLQSEPTAISGTPIEAAPPAAGTSLRDEYKDRD